MGGQVSLNWAAANRDKVSCLVSVIPVVDPNDIVVNNRSGYAGLVNAAYQGGWSQATYGSTYNPLTLAQAGRFAGLPMLLFYGTTDALCVPAQTQAFATAAGPSCTLVPVTGGHALSTYDAVNHAQIVAFIQANA